MARKKKKPASLNVAKRLQRKLAIQQGFYDGRFMEKSVPDRKKAESRKKSRQKFRLKDLDE